MEEGMEPARTKSESEGTGGARRAVCTLRERSAIADCADARLGESGVEGETASPEWRSVINMGGVCVRER